MPKQTKAERDAIQADCEAIMAELVDRLAAKYNLHQESVLELILTCCARLCVRLGEIMGNVERGKRG